MLIVLYGPANSGKTAMAERLSTACGVAALGELRSDRPRPSLSFADGIVELRASDRVSAERRLAEELGASFELGSSTFFLACPWASLSAHEKADATARLGLSSAQAASLSFFDIRR